MAVYATVNLNAFTDADFADPGGTGQPPGGLYEWLIFIRREDLQQIPEGDFVQSLIVTRPDGIYDDLWRGTFTNTVGPTR